MVSVAQRHATHQRLHLVPVHGDAQHAVGLAGERNPRGVPESWRGREACELLHPDPTTPAVWSLHTQCDPEALEFEDM